MGYTYYSNALLLIAHTSVASMFIYYRNKNIVVAKLIARLETIFTTPKNV